MPLSVEQACANQIHDQTTGGHNNHGAAFHRRRRQPAQIGLIKNEESNNHQGDTIDERGQNADDDGLVDHQVDLVETVLEDGDAAGNRDGDAEAEDDRDLEPRFGE